MAAAKLDTIVPTGAPADTERIAAAVTREAVGAMVKAGGPRSQWVAIGILAAAFAWHVLGDGTVREEARSTRRLVVWLVRCEHARQRGEAPPEYPLEEL